MKIKFIYWGAIMWGRCHICKMIFYELIVKTFVHDFFVDFRIKNRRVLDNFDFTKFYFKIAERRAEQIVVKMSSIISKCVLIDVNSKSYLTDFLYDREHDLFLNWLFIISRTFS